MYWFTFHGINGDRDQLYHYARDQDKAIKALGPRILDSVIPGLSCQIPAADSNKGSLFYNHLLTQGNKDTDCSIDSSMSREERIKYALEIASASPLVERSKLSPFSFVDGWMDGSIFLTTLSALVPALELASWQTHNH